MRPRYKPQPKDIRWAQEMMSIINDGGALVFPSENLHYLVFHSPVTR
jgi:hypothetical protein